MSPNGSVNRYRFPCLSTWTLPRSVAFSIGSTRGSTNATPPVLGLRATRRGRGLVCRGASAGSAIVVSIVTSKALRLIGHDERIDQPIDVPVHHLRQCREIELDPVVRQAVLREVVRPDLVRTIAAADHRPAGCRVRLALLLQLPLVEARPKHGQRLRLVLVLALLVLDLDDE